MKVLIKPFLAWLKKAIDIDIAIRFDDGAVILVLTVALAGKVLFTEGWTWKLPGSAVESGDELEEVTPPVPAVHTFARVMPVQPRLVRKVRWAPHRVPTLDTKAATVTRNVA